MAWDTGFMTRTHLSYMDRIASDPGVMAGKPVVKGTRVPVERVIQHLADNPDVKDLLLAFPHLNLEDVQACLAYAHSCLDRGRRVPAAK